MVLSILLLLIFGTTSVFSAIMSAALVAGLWKMFSKCGLPGWRALIPFYREYSLGEITNMETEGMAACLPS